MATYTKTTWVNGQAPAINGTNLNNIEAGVDALYNEFDANTILKADADNTPIKLTVAASTFLGRKAAGNIAAMTIAEAKTLLAIAIADLTDSGDILKKDGSVAMTGSLDMGGNSVDGADDINVYGLGTASQDQWAGLKHGTDQGDIYFIRGASWKYPIRFGHANADIVSRPTGVAAIRELYIDNKICIPNHTPSSASDTGTAGTICYDSSYIYICVATDTWERVAIASW